MASSSKKSKPNLLGKRKPEDDLATKPIPKRHKEKEITKEQLKGRVELLETKSDQAKEPEKKLFVDNLSWQTETSDIIDFFKDVGKVVRVQPSLHASNKGRRVSCGYIEFASADEAKNVLEKKNGESLHDREIILDAYKLNRRREDPEIAAPKKTLFVKNLPPQTEISDIIEFFQDVGQVVRVRRLVNNPIKYRSSGYVEFASANEAKKALEKKKGEYLHDCQIFLDVANGTDRKYIPPVHCIDHKVWYQDYLPQQESLPIKEDETPPNFVGEVLFVTNLSPQTTRLSHIINFFEDVGQVVSVRLIVNEEGKHVGHCFVEFASTDEAKWALENKNGEYLHDHKILLMKGQDQTPDSVEAAAVLEKTLYFANLSREAEISDIISFFKDVGQVVGVQLTVKKSGKRVGKGFVEFTSANVAKKALEKKNGEYLLDCQIFLDVAKTNPRHKFCVDHKVWYEDYLGSILIEEDAAVEVLDETPDFAEEVAAREKTVFVANVSLKRDAIGDLINIRRIFKRVGKVVRARLMVDHRGELVGCCFVEFSSADEAKKAVKRKDGGLVYVNMAEIAPYPFRRRYNLYKLAKKLWYEDNLRREGLGLMNKPKLELKKPQAIFCGTKTVLAEEEALVC